MVHPKKSLGAKKLIMTQQTKSLKQMIKLKGQKTKERFKFKSLKETRHQLQLKKPQK